ncbi:hypothetical protein G9C98_006410 [Cotesia typhae]|uniref:Glucose-methanol-choline oxidoreductase N-terminal domain-containing protein n=1 Tax=Cotesia typhae TaxID=2053667 RepID=A0A8J5UUY1_9HYME|nr:hypothetical protein G9C98_006410 [Cotesia typhae]
MDLIIKWTAYWIYAIGVFFFINYLNIFYLISTIIDYLGSNFENGQFFDYVIVGAGSAGITLASKLTDAGHKVIIIEAGGSAPPFADIPVLASLFQLSNYDWKYKTTSQKHACKALVNNQSRWPMGKILGGSSRLNYMAYVEGHPQDYQWFADYKSYKLNGVSDTRHCSELCDKILEGAEEINQEAIDNELLEFRKIKVINDLPVGKNLVDHILTGIDLVILEKKLSVSVPELLKPTSVLNYFFNQQGLKLIAKLVKTRAMKTLGASLYTRPFPGCEGMKFGTDNYWRCYIQQLTLTSYHPAGTCRLGSVVNNSFRVLGTKNLFVVDASILPSLPSGNINAAVMMIASKAADLINKSMSELNQTKNYFCPKSNYVSDIFNLPNVCLKSL